MPEQTSIPVPEEPQDDGPCVWCGKPSVGMVEVEPARWGTAVNGARVLKRRALEARACEDHIGIVDRQPKPDEAEGWTRIRSK